MVWAVDCNSQKRHCWDRTDGTRVLDGSFDKLCHEDHSDNPKVVGKVEWLRFIHAWEHEPNVFTEGGHLNLNVDGAPTSDGRVAYAEEYFDEADTLIFRIFLRQNQGWARIECYDPELFSECDATWKRVQESYE